MSQTRGSAAIVAAVLTVGLALVAPTRVARSQPATKEQGQGKPKLVEATDPPKSSQVSDLSTRYKLLERYVVGNPQAGEIGQYRVASREVIRDVTDKAQGAPDRKQRTIQVIYTERPGLINSSQAVTATVRHYDAMKVTPQAEVKPSVRKPLEGLTAWVQTRPGTIPMVLSLTPGYPLSDTEFNINTRMLMFMPDLSGVLPALAMRVGDHWPVARPAAQALLGDKPLKQNERLSATLNDIRKAAPDSPDLVAVIGVTGHAQMPPRGNDTSVNAEILFRFTPSATSPEGSSTPVEARGAITEVRLARTSTGAAPGSEGRLKRVLTWELTLQRDLVKVGDPLAVPNPAPEPTDVNSWLTYDDPKGRFHFRHPQDMLPLRDPMIEDGIVTLVDDRAAANEGRRITIVLQAKTGNAETDRNNRDPEFQKKELNASLAAARRDVLPGPAGWLPEAEWSPYKMKVFRIQIADKPAGLAGKDLPRTYLDHYLVLFSQNESLSVDATTAQDPPAPFRKQVETILKTFSLGASSKPTS